MTTSNTNPVLEQRAIPLRDMGLLDEEGEPFTLLVLLTQEGGYIPLNPLCALIGIADTKQQRERIQRHYILGEMLRTLPYATRAGMREGWCLHLDGLGFWLGTIQDTKVRASVKPWLIAIQRRVVDAARSVVLPSQVGALGTSVALASDAHLPTLEEARTSSRLARTEEQVEGVTAFVLDLAARVGDLESAARGGLPRIVVPEEGKE